MQLILIFLMAMSCCGTAAVQAMRKIKTGLTKSNHIYDDTLGPERLQIFL